MAATTIDALFQWIVTFLEKLVAKFKELMGIVSAEEDSSEA